ncbi:MAG: pilin [Patescibacteria group bacterium]
MKDINDVSDKFINLGNTFLQVLIAFAIIWIVFNIVRYMIVGADSDEKRATARQAIIWGVIGLAIILSIWGIVNVVIKTFVFDNNTAPTGQFPCIPKRGQSTCQSTGGAGSNGGNSGYGPAVAPDINGNVGEDSASFYNDQFLNGSNR